MTDPTNLAALARRTQQIYERNAVRFDAERPRHLHEKAWLDRFAAHLPANASVLDVGCGSGDPIAAYLSRLGFAVTGLDAARAMIELAEARFPHGEWVRADMRDFDLGRRFDGVIGWDSFFHLTQTEQRAVLVRLAAHVAPGGALMLTVGPEAGEVTGRVGDDPVYHSSLAPREYREILHDLDFQEVDFVPEDPTCDFHSVLLARRPSG